MAKKKKAAPKKSLDQLVKELEKKLGDTELSKEEFDEALKKVVKKPDNSPEH